MHRRSFLRLPKITGSAPPAVIEYLVWAVVVLVIVVALLRATGLLSSDPQIPRLR